ncbi:MAG: ABC transporter substrate-binding protein [Usitatibacter sp.]
MNRRELLLLAAISPLGALTSRAEDSDRLPRVALLMFGSPMNFRSRIDAFRAGMEDLGYVEGRNILFEWHSANGQMPVLQELARSLGKGSVDVIVSASTLTTHALQQAGVTHPVVMAAVDDPVAEGFAKSLARPGTNYTGLSANVVGEAHRFIELLAMAAGKLTRVGLLANPSNPTYRAAASRFEGAAARVGAKLTVLDASTLEQLETASPPPGEANHDGIVVMYDSLFYNNRIRVVELARDTRRPVIYPQRGYVEAGGLMSYGPQLEQSYRRVASYVSRILKGARPADLPIEPPAKLELVINRTAARGLGVQLPPSFLKKADKIIG